MTISRPIALVLLCLLAASACAAADAGAAGGVGGGGVGGGGSGFGGGIGSTTTLLVESESSVTMLPMEQAEIMVRYVDDNGAPISDATVSFTLVGRAQDSGLSRLTTTTDGAGHASTTVLAGAARASFQVRASAAGAAAVVIDVAVSDRGFGNLRVTAAYTGVRLVTQRRVALFAGLTCDQLDGAASPDRQSNLTGQTDDARFIGLPAETSYAVLAVGFGEPAIALTQDCVDAVVIAADVEVDVNVTLQDLDLSPWGDYDLTATLGTAAVASDLADHVRAYVMAAEPGLPTSPAQRLLIALDGVLRADVSALPQLAAADVLMQLRDQGVADVDLQLAMDTELVGPSKAQDWVAEQLTVALATIELDLGVRVVEGTPDPSIAWTLLRAATAPSTEFGGIEHVIVDPVASITTPSFLWSRDQMTTTSAVPSIFGALAVDVIDVLLGANGSGGAGRASAQDRLGCAELQRWVAAQNGIVAACDAACVNAACDNVLSGWLDALEASLLALDQSRSVVSLGATFDLHDTTADAAVDAFETQMLTATWEADPLDVDATGSYMTGSASAVMSPMNASADPP